MPIGPNELTESIRKRRMFSFEQLLDAIDQKLERESYSLSEDFKRVSILIETQDVDLSVFHDSSIFDTLKKIYRDECSWAELRFHKQLDEYGNIIAVSISFIKEPESYFPTINRRRSSYEP